MESPPDIRWVCTACGVLDGVDEPECCPACGDEVLDMEKGSDEKFLYELVNQRRASRWVKGMSIGLLVSALLWGLVLTVLITPVFPQDPEAIQQTISLAESMDYYRVADEVKKVPLSERSTFAEILLLLLAHMPDIFYLAGVVVFGWGYAVFQRRRQPEAVQRAEEFVRREHRSDTFRMVVTSPAVLAVALLVLGFAGVMHGHEETVAMLALDPELLRQGQELWRVLSAPLVHLNIVNLLYTLLGLLYFGVIVDLRIGHLRTAAVMLAATVVGALLHGLLTPDPQLLFVGAGAIVFGLIGANMALVPGRKVPVPLFGMYFMVPTVVWALAFGVFFVGMELYFSEQVAWLAYLGGFAAGLLMAIPFRSLPIPPVKQRLEARRQKNLAGVELL